MEKKRVSQRQDSTEHQLDWKLKDEALQIIAEASQEDRTVSALLVGHGNAMRNVVRALLNGFKEDVRNSSQMESRILQSILYSALVDHHGFTRREQSSIDGYTDACVERGAVEVIGFPSLNRIELGVSVFIPFDPREITPSHVSINGFHTMGAKKCRSSLSYIKEYLSVETRKGLQEFIPKLLSVVQTGRKISREHRDELYCNYEPTWRKKRRRRPDGPIRIPATKRTRAAPVDG